MKQDKTELINTLLKQFSIMEDRRKRYETSWKDVTDFILPRRSVWEVEDETEPPVPKLFNSHAIYALKLQSYGFEGYMVSRTKPWFKLKIVGKNGELPGVADWLEEIEGAINTELQASNFYEATSEFIPDAGSIGTATMYSQEDIKTGKTFFTCRHPKEIYIEENNYGQVDTVFRKFRLTYRQAMQQFGDKNHTDIKERVKETPYAYLTMLHIVKPRTDRDINSPLSKDMPWASYYIDLKNKHIVTEGGYEEMPYHCWRWIKNSDEVYGRSPGIDAITDTKRLNQISRTQLNLAQLTSDPPWNIPEGIKGEERILPHGMNYVTTGETVAPVAVGANYPINVDIEKRVEAIIDQHFNVNFFLMISQQERDMTAREVAERKGEQAAVLGAAIGRYESEGLAPIIERVYGILNRRGNLPPPPPTLQQSGGKIDIEYTGLLAQIQKKYFQTSGIQQALEFLMPVAQMNPAILDNIDMDELTRNAMDGYGLPQKTLREIPDIQKLREARAQQEREQQQQAMALEQQKIVASNADKLNTEVQPGTMLDKIGQQGAQR